ncbi:MAG: c-type cytochrome domain-containing protein [Pirellulales bacterium]
MAMEMTLKTKHILGWFCALSASLSAAVSGNSRAEDKVTFDDHIKPIFREHCLSCHNANEKKGGLALDTYAATLIGGSSGEIVIAGDIDSSRLWELTAHIAQPYMPPQQDKLADPKLAVIKTWIEQGMPENSGSAIKKKSDAAAAMLANSSTGKPDGPPPMPTSMLKQPAIYTPRSAAIAAMAGAPWSPLVAVGGQFQVSLYHSESGQLLGVIPFPEGEPQSLSFTRDGRQLLIGGGRHGRSGCAVLVDVATGERITKVGDELDVVLAADISPDKKRIALAGPQKLIRIYDSSTGELIKEMKKHTDWVYALRFSPDGVLLASGDRSNGLVVWESETGRLYADLVGHKGEIRSLDFRADSNVLLTASLDGTVKFWGMQDSNLQKSIDAHGGGATSVAFSQDGSFVTTGRDQRVRLWNPDGTKKAEYEGLTEAGLEVAVIGSGAQIAAGDWNGKVKLWQAADPKQVRELAANPLTLAQVLEQAQASATQIKTTFDAASMVAADSAAQMTAAQSELAQTEVLVKTSAEQLAATEQTKQKLTGDINAQTAMIADLEAKLAAVKKAKEDTTVALNTATETAKKQMAESEAAKAKQVDAKTKYDQLAVAAKAAADKLAEADAQFKASQDAVARAQADLTAFQARSADLKASAEKVAAQTAETEKQMAEKAKLAATKEAEMKKLTEELQKMQAEMAALQQKLAAAASAQTTAQSELSASQAAANELKAAFEKAQSDSAQAQERLKLFLDSYK